MKYSSIYTKQAIWFFLVALLQVNHITAVDDICRDANDVLVANNDITNSFIAMMDDFNENCNGEQCQYSIDPITSDLTQNWDSLSSFTLGAMKTACEFFSQRKVCEVTSVVEFTNLVEIDGVTIYTDIKEDKRPICFPPTCSESEVSTVHSSPADCSPGDSNCEVLSYSVDCPSRSTSNGNCANDVLSSTHLFNTLQTIFQGNILLNCQEALDSGDTNLCSLDISQVEVTLDYSYEDFLDDSAISEHRQLCYNVGGQECLVDVTASFPTTLEILEFDDVTDLDIGDLSVEGTFTKTPVCLPVSCSNEDVITLAQEYVLSNIEDIAGAICGESSIPCAVEVTNVACTAPSSNPTIFPTFQASNAPSFQPSSLNLPSAIPSSSTLPSLSPSQFPSLLPTSSEQPSSYPIFSPSSSPSISSSSLPSLDPSLFSTESPTASPTISVPTLSPTSTLPCRSLSRLIRSFLRRFD